MDFPRENAIFEALWKCFTDQVPEVTFNKKGGVAWALLRTVAYGIRLLAVAVLERIYAAIWPQFADVTALRNWLEVFGEPWVPGRGLDATRRHVVALFRANAWRGTARWYAEEAVRLFDEVTDAVALPGRRGPNTLDLAVTNAGRDVLDTAAVQAYFDDPGRLVLAADVRVVNASTLAAEAEAAAIYWENEE